VCTIIDKSFYKPGFPGVGYPAAHIRISSSK
jgi:hypothetical protein